MKIDSVPEKITRKQLRDLVSSLGIDPDAAINMTVTPEFIAAEVLATNDDGYHYSVRDGGEPFVATHTVMIQVTDDDEDLDPHPL